MIDCSSNCVDSQFITRGFYPPDFFPLLTVEQRRKESNKAAKLRYRSKPETKVKESEFGKVYRSNNRERFKPRITSYNKKYNDSHREQKRIYNRKWESENREYHRNAQRGRYKRNIQHPEVRLKLATRSRIYSGFKRYIRGVKTKRSIDLLGCSFEHLKSHLESQFKFGMTWENHGVKGWHIDHIRPVDSFNLLDEDQQKQCFHYTNLQPLWWHENLRKGATCLDCTQK